MLSQYSLALLTPFFFFETKNMLITERRWRACWFCLVLLLAAEANCQLSKPVAANKHWDEQTDNKFLQRTAENDKDESQ